MSGVDGVTRYNGLMRVRFIVLNKRQCGALRSLDWDLPEEPGWALMGLDNVQGTVPHAIPLRLDLAPTLTWWAGQRSHLERWADAEGLIPVRRWPLSWSTAVGSCILEGPAQVMGIVNVTPDSFSDGGRNLDPAQAVAEALRQRAAGAYWIDVGGESTRPGHQPVREEDEWARIAPVLNGLRAQGECRVSVDTRHAAVARLAARAGAAVINDISCMADDAMLDVLASGRVGYVLTYNRPKPFQEGEVDLGAMIQTFRRKLEHLTTIPGGVERVALDPGLGFGYEVADNLTVLANLEVFRVFDRPLLVGPSRKRFIGQVTGRPVSERDTGSAVACAWAVWHGADMVRVHHVEAGLDAVKLAEAVIAHG